MPKPKKPPENRNPYRFVQSVDGFEQTDWYGEQVVKKVCEQYNAVAGEGVYSPVMDNLDIRDVLAEAAVKAGAVKNRSARVGARWIASYCGEGTFWFPSTEEQSIYVKAKGVESRYVPGEGWVPGGVCFWETVCIEKENNNPQGTMASSPGGH